MKCCECRGLGYITVYGILTGEIGDMSTEEWRCEHCDGTGVEPPDEDVLADMDMEQERMELANARGQRASHI